MSIFQPETSLYKIMNFATIGEIQTAANGTSFVSLPSLKVVDVTIFNASGTTIEVRRNGGGTALKLPDGSCKTFDVLNDQSELGLRRSDASATQVTIQYESRN